MVNEERFIGSCAVKALHCFRFFPFNKDTPGWRNVKHTHAGIYHDPNEQTRSRGVPVAAKVVSEST